MCPMEHLIREIEDYARATGRKPQWVLRASVGYGWGVWDQWVSGLKSPTMVTADRIREWMAANPPKDATASSTQEDAA